MKLSLLASASLAAMAFAGSAWAQAQTVGGVAVSGPNCPSANAVNVGYGAPLTLDQWGRLCVHTEGITVGNVTVGNISLGCSTAQIGVVTPLTETTTNLSGTVTTGGTFQNISNANTGRRGCLIQNPVGASETLYVYFGAGTASEGNSTSLGAGSAVSCYTGSGILGDEIQITGNTTAHAFIATVQ